MSPTQQTLKIESSKEVIGQPKVDPRYWIVVASKNHIQRGLADGFAQANHGKPSPLKRMRVGDGVVCYSPKLEFGGDEKCQAFTAIGTVIGEEVYQHDMGNGFVPFRRDVTYFDAEETSILPLIPALSFIREKKSWGFVFRFGFFEIPKNDYDLIASCMMPERIA